MWHTPSGDRTLTGPESALVREAIALMADTLHEEADGYSEDWPCGVKLYDELPWQQRLALLLRVSSALLKPDVPAPELSAVNEAAVAALFEHISRQLVMEVDEASDPDYCTEFDAFHLRRLIAACQQRPSVDMEFFVAVDSDDVDSDDVDDWELLIESISDGVLWDNDWAMQDMFLDAPPSASRREKRRMGIELDYFAEPAPDLRDEQAPSVFKELMLLAGDTAPPTEQ